MKKITYSLIISLVFVMLLALGVSAATSGTAGELDWKIETNTLTISGEGEMPDYKAEKAPWYSSAATITKLVVDSGVENIGNYAFYGLTKLSNVKIAKHNFVCRKAKAKSM